MCQHHGQSITQTDATDGHLVGYGNNSDFMTWVPLITVLDVFSGFAMANDHSHV